MYIFDISFHELSSLLNDWGEPSFRALQIWQGLYQQFWNSWEDFSNLPSFLRSKLAENLQFQVISPVTSLTSIDKKTEKTLFQLYDDNAIEAVLMRYAKRNTLCISTQVGCAMACVFCATGQMGFRRHLTSGEIVAQVMYYAHLLHKAGEVVTNVVIMGMGEPFHNYENTISAIDRLNDPLGYNFGSRRFTVSTVGLIPSIRRFSHEKRQINLAISLHSADDNLRTTMLPVNKRYPLDELFNACQEYVDLTGRRITFEWALVNGINDTSDQAHLLVKRVSGLLCHVNAIPLNPTLEYKGKATTRERAEKFKEILNSSGVPCTIRLRRGLDIQAGCGQLAVKGK